MNHITQSAHCSSHFNRGLFRIVFQVLKKRMGEALWHEKEKLALEETLPKLKGPLTSDAWLGVGWK